MKITKTTDCYLPSTIFGKMTLFVTAIPGDLGDNLGLFFYILSICSLDNVIYTF